MAKSKKIGNVEKLLSRKEGLFTMKELLEYMMQSVIGSEVTEIIGAEP